jgi:uncharacterized protein YecE (DUF72 family)
MDEPRQERLFAENPGGISPPEPGLYLGTSGWSYADWEGTLYPEGLQTASRLAEYAKHYTTVVVAGVQNPQEVTHERNLVGSEAEAERFVRTMAELGDRLGPLLLQLPPSFGVEGMGVLEDFLKRLPGGFRYAVEVRHRSWLGSDLPALLREHGVALTLIDYPRIPRMDDATADFVYIRWLGDRREFPSGHTHARRDRTDNLEWWAGVVDRFIKAGKTVFAYANNLYQNHAPSTVERFLEIRRGI